MFKNIFKILLVITILITVGLSIFNYYKYIQTKNYNILNDRQSMIIELPNGQYLEIIARNDTVFEGENVQKPFSMYTKVQKNTLLESAINVYDVYKEDIFNEGNSRSTVLTPLNNSAIRVRVESKTDYMFSLNLKYGIQLDYSGPTVFTDEVKNIQFKDQGCTILINKVGGYEYVTTGEGRSLRIEQKYEPETKFEFDININCIQ